MAVDARVVRGAILIRPMLEAVGCVPFREFLKKKSLTFVYFLDDRKAFQFTRACEQVIPCTARNFLEISLDLRSAPAFSSTPLHLGSTAGSHLPQT